MKMGIRYAPAPEAVAVDPEPIQRTVAGIELVTIPLDLYAELLRCRRIVAENNLRAHMPTSAASRVDRDPEVAAFLAEHVGRLTLREVCTLVVARFGSQRAPSRSTIQRFRHRLLGSR